jgi:hypothetical protein
MQPGTHPHRAFCAPHISTAVIGCGGSMLSSMQNASNMEIMRLRNFIILPPFLVSAGYNISLSILYENPKKATEISVRNNAKAVAFYISIQYDEKRNCTEGALL